MSNLASTTRSQDPDAGTAQGHAGVVMPEQELLIPTAKISTTATQSGVLFETIVEAAPVAVVLVDQKGHIAFVNRETEQLFGYSRDELLGRSLEILVPVALRTIHKKHRDAFFSEPRTRAMGVDRELFARRKDQSEFPVEVALEPVHVGADRYVLSIVVDITERKRLERKFQGVIEAAPVAMLLVDSDGRIVLVNRETEKLYGYSRTELIGQPVEFVVPERLRGDTSATRDRFFQAAVARRLGAPGHDFFGLRKDGSEVPIEVGLNPIPSERGISALITVIDVTNRRRLEADIRRVNEVLEQRVLERTAQLERANREKETLLVDLQAQRLQLERLSREDPLTGLANRRDFDERLGAEIRRAERFGTPLAVAMLDLDKFKSVNDRFGHALGDAVLQHTARLMRHECRTVDLLARYGGEEFAIAMPTTDLRAGITLCNRIRQAIARFNWSELATGLGVTISAGVTVWARGATIEQIMSCADDQLYAAKRAGRNRVRPVLNDSPQTPPASS